MNMKHLKIKILLSFCLASCVNLVAAQEFSLKIVKAGTDRDAISAAIIAINPSHELVKDQAVVVQHAGEKFFIAPIISTQEKGGGCYLHVLDNKHQLQAKYLVEKTEDAQSCDAVIAVYGCRLPSSNGLGVIAGLRLGANNYFEQGSFFDLEAGKSLRENTALGKKISALNSVAKARKALGCLK